VTLATNHETSETLP